MDRIEVAAAVRTAFERGPAARDDLVRTARDHGAGDDVVGLLERLPARSWRRLNDVWPDLPDLPVRETDVAR